DDAALQHARGKVRVPHGPEHDGVVLPDALGQLVGEELAGGAVVLGAQGVLGAGGGEAEPLLGEVEHAEQIGGKRPRISYELTAEGKEQFQTLMEHTGPMTWEDDTFDVHFAFFGRASSDVRLRILEGRRSRLEERLDAAREQARVRRERTDRYTAELHRHGLESTEREVRWLVAQDIAAAGVPVIANGLLDLPETFEQLGATQSNAGRMMRAGVKVAINAATMQDPRRLQQVAGNLVALNRMPGATGMSWGQAFAAISSVPAEIAGMGGKAGVLKAGALGDVVIWSEDPLEAGAVPTQVFIGGIRQDLTNHQTRLRDRYRTLDESQRPEAYDW
ncbi:amidohydrolase family protein, partial [uncultured Bradyrhizobium sp.]|uniref:amidohydrolase family protein n=1 Tax=uncultured Bradyrhizobium sp. TaxID=199684 RepID=UPI0026377E06